MSDGLARNLNLLPPSFPTLLFPPFKSVTSSFLSIIQTTLPPTTKITAPIVLRQFAAPLEPSKMLKRGGRMNPATLHPESTIPEVRPQLLNHSES